ncbi:hypothetical protein HK102_003501 [Quaeritorhiza haematococci]|nr:hypothetical protein HK102_003501 [Quaeritorhiza haematococci]
MAVTFDDGPDPTGTPLILDFLKEQEIRATFFVLGSEVNKYPELLRRIWEEGHQIASHTYSHPSLPNLVIQSNVNVTGARGVVEEMQVTADEILRTIGVTPKWMRPPFGQMDVRTKDALNGLNYIVANWNVDTKDWTPVGRTAMVRTYDQLADVGYPRGIVTLHHDRDVVPPGAFDLVKEAILLAKQRGFEFDTIADCQVTEPQTYGPAMRGPRKLFARQGSDSSALFATDMYRQEDVIQPNSKRAEFLAQQPPTPTGTPTTPTPTGSTPTNNVARVNAVSSVGVSVAVAVAAMVWGLFF